MRESAMTLYQVAQSAIDRNLDGYKVKWLLAKYGENPKLVKDHWTPNQCAEALFAEGDTLRAYARYEAR